MGHAASMSLYDYCSGDAVNYLDPDGRDKYMGGSREGTGHFWTAVDLPNGHVVRYDFSAANYNAGGGGSGGSAGDLVRTLDTKGKVEVTEHDSIEKAAGRNEYYKFSKHLIVTHKCLIACSKIKLTLLIMVY
jgi:hypothetical protein